MDDRIAGANVMTYYDGEGLNWHFDRSEFTTTLLLQAPSAGGAFEYLRDLRSEDDPNYDGVAALLNGELGHNPLPTGCGHFERVSWRESPPIGLLRLRGKSRVSMPF